MALQEVEGFALWPQHRAAAEAFLAVANQWRVLAAQNGRQVWLGLDYAAARAGLDLAGIMVAPEVWAQVRLIEAGALEALNEV